MTNKENGSERDSIPLSELSEQDLAPGSVIEGVKTFDDLDTFIGTLVTGIAAAHSNADTAFAASLKQSSLDRQRKDFIEQGRRKHFNGKLENFHVTILQFDELPNKPSLKGSLNPNEATTFIVEVDMVSTGRGKVGSLKRLMGLQLSSSPDTTAKIYLPDGKVHQCREIQLNSRPIDEQNSREQIDDLIARSHDVSVAVWLHALRNMASAGLPGLGKRR